MSRKIARTLYKNKLKSCRLMGYQYGNWNKKYICSLDSITDRKIRSYMKKGELGNFVWNNVRMAYKISMNIQHIPELQQYTFDYGFEQLKNINFLLYEYKKKVTLKLLG